MTPAEARQVDKEEFAAECAAIRQRAYAYVERRRYEARREIANWLGREIPKFNVRPFRPFEPEPTSLVNPRRRARRQSPKITVNGVTKTIVEWAAHLGLTPNALHVRANRLGSYDAAIALGSKQRRTKSTKEPSSRCDRMHSLLP